MGDHQVYLLVLNCRLSPRRKTERDVTETAGTGGRRRRMSLRWKAKTGGPSVLMPFHLGDIRLRHPFWPSQSRRRTSPRRMAPDPETDDPETDGPETDVAETDDPETDVAETDDPETEVPETDGAETDGSETDGPETDAPETDGAKTDAPETEVPETEEDRDGGRRDGRCVCFCLFALLKDCGRL